MQISFTHIHVLCSETRALPMVLKVFKNNEGCSNQLQINAGTGNSLAATDQCLYIHAAAKPSPKKHDCISLCCCFGSLPMLVLLGVHYDCYRCSSSCQGPARMLHAAARLLTLVSHSTLGDPAFCARRTYQQEITLLRKGSTTLRIVPFRALDEAIAGCEDVGSAVHTV